MSAIGTKCKELKLSKSSPPCPTRRISIRCASLRWGQRRTLRPAATYRLPCTEFRWAEATRLQDVTGFLTSLDFRRSSWYQHVMNKSVRNFNSIHMTRFGWAVEGVAR